MTNEIVDYQEVMKTVVEEANKQPEQKSYHKDAAKFWREKGDQLVRDAEEAKAALYKYADGLEKTHEEMEEYWNNEKAYIDRVYNHIHEAPRHNGTGNK